LAHNGDLSQSKLTYEQNQLWEILPFNKEWYIISGSEDKNLEVLGDNIYNELSVVIRSARLETY